MPTEPQPALDFPPFFAAGTTLKVQRQFDQYGSATWNYQLLLAGAQVLSVAGTADPDGMSFLVEATPAQTAKLNTRRTPEAYSYVERLTATDGSGEIYDVRSGRIMVNPNLALLNPGDALTHEERTLRIIEAKLENRLAADLENYSIAGRSISRIPVQELIKLRGTYANIVWKQRNPGKLTTPVDIVFPPTSLIGPEPRNMRDVWDQE
jgi:hypothetical protein